MKVFHHNFFSALCWKIFNFFLFYFYLKILFSDAQQQTCESEEECADDPLTTCDLRVDQFRCVCSSGYTGSFGNCIDINECQVGPSRCSPQATCDNTNGSFSCSCNSGFSGDGVTCVGNKRFLCVFEFFKNVLKRFFSLYLL